MTLHPIWKCAQQYARLEEDQVLYEVSKPATEITGTLPRPFIAGRIIKPLWKPVLAAFAGPTPETEGPAFSTMISLTTSTRMLATEVLKEAWLRQNVQLYLPFQTGDGSTGSLRPPRT